MKIVQKVLMALALAVLIGTALFVVIYWPHIPDAVPTHFANSGEPDSYGGKSMVLVPLIVGFIAYISTGVMSFFPNLWNIPKGWSTAPIKGMVAVLDLIIALAFSWLTVCTARSTGLSVWFGIGLVAAISGTVGVGMFLSYKRK